MEPLVMIVDDEPINVRVFSRMLTEHGIHCMTALSGAECLQKIDERKPDVILLDAMMPVMNGFELARHLKANPETNFIPLVMVTALTDLEARIRALDAGVDDFLSKPVDYAELLARVNASFKVKQYHDEIMRQKREKEELLNKTLKGTIRLLVEILALTNPAGFSQCSRLVPLTRKLAQYMMAEDAWQAEMAMMLSPIVEIMIPPALVDKMRRGDLLEPDEQKMYGSRTKQGIKLLGDIPHLQDIARALAYRHKNFDGSGMPADRISGNEIPVAARIAKAVFDYDRLSVQYPSADVVAMMRQCAGGYDPNILALIEDLRRVVVPDSLIREVPVASLTPGMILAQDVTDSGGRLLIGKGVEVTELLKLRLHYLAAAGTIRSGVRAYEGGLVMEKSSG